MWISKDIVPISFLMIWFGLMVLFLALRTINAKNLLRYIADKNEEKIRTLTKEFYLIVITTAILWNTLFYASYIYSPTEHIFLSLIIVLGLITAAIISLSPIVNLYYIYSGLLFIPQLIYIYLLDSTLTNAILLISMIYVPFILTLSKSVSKNLLKSIESLDELYELSIRDALTNAHNRHYFFDTGNKYLILGNRDNKSIVLLMMDLDFFKNINDTYGHLAGDYILIEVVKIIQNRVRKSDIFARIGGEEFSVLLYNTTLENALVVANSICSEIRERDFIYKETLIDVTISIGTAELSKKNHTLELLLHHADENLYRAKESGRDRVI